MENEQWSYLEIVPKILVQEQCCLIEQAGKYELSGLVCDINVVLLWTLSAVLVDGEPKPNDRASQYMSLALR